MFYDRGLLRCASFMCLFLSLIRFDTFQINFSYFFYVCNLLPNCHRFSHTQAHAERHIHTCIHTHTHTCHNANTYVSWNVVTKQTFSVNFFSLYIFFLLLLDSHSWFIIFCRAITIYLFLCVSKFIDIFFSSCAVVHDVFYFVYFDWLKSVKEIYIHASD